MAEVQIMEELEMSKILLPTLSISLTEMIVDRRFVTPIEMAMSEGDSK